MFFFVYFVPFVVNSFFGSTLPDQEIGKLKAKRVLRIGKKTNQSFLCALW